ncbi:serine O-acetyltransferase EpsC [Aquitalea sp. ASV11]|uniref:serine O-acetyltransferase EpsC n=1 Tax=Aquitalea sp. ASV11 TaxID=2795103 RepID=UPI0018EA8CB0|nr:serine O-acetyltransferase EpsC [Aquitalea sp. ASV11]
MNDLVRPFGPSQPVVHDWHLDSVVSALHAARADWRQSQGRLRDFSTREFPSRAALRDIVATLAAALFPMRLGPPGLRDSSEDFFVGHSLAVALDALAAQVVLELRYSARLNGMTAEDSEAQAVAIIQQFAAALPDQRRLLDADITAAWQGDPAARSVDEVLLCYPGINAILHHRLAHLLYRAGLPLIARIIAEIAHGETGIDIHPGAQIGAGFFIDHGTGVVIGETAVIGERVRLYQAVTLGAKRFEQGEDGSLLKGQPRHPIVEDDVVIYAGATVLGRITIGRGSSIGGNVWLTRSVPPGSQITQASLQG